MPWLHTSFGAAAAFSVRGSKPEAMPALEQNRSIGPWSRSTVSISDLICASSVTSQAKARPPIAAATSSAASASISATTIFAAPAWWNAWAIALPMPLPPPVMTKILPATFMALKPL